MVPGAKRTLPSRAVNGSSDARMLISIAYRSPAFWRVPRFSLAQTLPKSVAKTVACASSTFSRTSMLNGRPKLAIVGQNACVAAVVLCSVLAKGPTMPCESAYTSPYEVQASV